jgi:hypothetical protein
MISAVSSVSSVHVELDGRMSSTTGRTDETTKQLMDTCITLINYVDRSLNEAASDKIRKYRADYNHNPPNAIFFMSVIVSTSGRLHSDFVRLLFLQAHRETDRFFPASGVQIPQHNYASSTTDTQYSPHS